MFKKLTLRAKLLMSFLTIAGLVCTAGFGLLPIISKNLNVSNSIVNDGTARIVNLQNLDEEMANTKGDLILYTSQNLTKQEEQAAKDQLQNDIKSLHTTIAEPSLNLTAANDEGVTLKQELDTYLQQAQEIIDTKNTITLARLNQEKNAFFQLHSDIDNDLGTVISAELTKLEADRAKVASENSTVVMLGWITVASSTTLAVFFGMRLSSSLTKGLRQLQGSAEHVANGDFTQKIKSDSHDEVGKLSRTFNQMSERLRDSYHRLEFEKTRDEILLESLGEGLLAIDNEGRVVLVNHNALDLLELRDKHSVINQQIEHLFIVLKEEGKKGDIPLPDNERPELMTLRTGHPQGGTFGFQRISEGRKIVISLNAYPVVQQSMTTGAIVVIRDITKEKEIDRMKTEFISLASHQLRTPLSAIRWFAEMLINGDAGKLTDEQAEFATNISDSTQRMIDLVNSLLNISRIESGRIIVDPKPTDLQELVGGIVNDLKAKTAEKEQSLIISVHKELGKINLDPHLIGQVYLNFLTNAIKYTPKGGEISVFISRKDDQIISQITDNGYGIPVVQQERVFQKFFRAENVAKFETDGTGLGLYLVKAIIESSGGKVWFKSEQDKGTTFWFTLPSSGMKAKEGEVTLDV